MDGSRYRRSTVATAILFFLLAGPTRGEMTMKAASFLFLGGEPQSSVDVDASSRDDDDASWSSFREEEDGRLLFLASLYSSFLAFFDDVFRDGDDRPCRS